MHTHDTSRMFPVASLQAQGKSSILILVSLRFLPSRSSRRTKPSDLRRRRLRHGEGAERSGGTNGAALAQTPQGFRNISSRLLFLGLLTAWDALGGGGGGDEHDSKRGAFEGFCVRVHRGDTKTSPVLAVITSYMHYNKLDFGSGAPSVSSTSCGLLAV